MSKLPCICNPVITNVPGTAVPLNLSGAKLVESFGMGPLIPNTSLFHTITSTGDSISISFVSCPEAMTSPAFYKQCLVESYQDLAERTDANAVAVPINEVRYAISPVSCPATFTSCRWSPYCWGRFA